MSPPNTRPSEVQALLDTMHPTSVYDGLDARPRHDAGGGPEQAVADLLRQVQAHVSELSRAREALANSLRDTEAQLSKVAAEAAALRTERDHLARLKALYERKFASIRELTHQ